MTTFLLCVASATFAWVVPFPVVTKKALEAWSKLGAWVASKL